MASRIGCGSGTIPRHRQNWLVVPLIVALASPCAAASQDLPDWLATDLRNAGVPATNVTVYVQEVGTGTALISHNATKPFKPASIMKLVTTFAALDVLGERYRWRTPVYATGPVHEGILHGDLIIRGVGDPHMTQARLAELSSRLVRAGVRTIKGDLVLDNSFFGSDARVPQRFYSETENPWNLPPQPLLVNGKLVTLTLTPSIGGTRPQVAVEPELPAVRVENRLTQTDAPCTGRPTNMSLVASGTAHSALLTLTGSLSTRCSGIAYKVSVLDSETYFLESFRQAMARAGGRLQGSVRSGTSASQARLVATIQSDNILDILRETNKHSNNLMAQQLFVAVGAALSGRSPSPRQAAATVKRWLVAHVPEARPFVLDNGAGLSTEERVTAQGMVALLERIRTSPNAAQFLETLPSVGEDGTMAMRLRDRPVAGRSAAKTGTLRDTRAIAGIVVNRYGRSYTFCMIVNHPNASATLPAIDQLIAWLHDMRPSRIAASE